MHVWNQLSWEHAKCDNLFRIDSIALVSISNIYNATEHFAASSLYNGT